MWKNSRIAFVVKDSNHFQHEDEYLSSDVHAGGSSSKCTEWGRDGDSDRDRDRDGTNSGKFSGFSWSEYSMQYFVSGCNSLTSCWWKIDLLFFGTLEKPAENCRVGRIWCSHGNLQWWNRPRGISDNCW